MLWEITCKTAGSNTIQGITGDPNSFGDNIKLLLYRLRTPWYTTARYKSILQVEIIDRKTPTITKYFT